MKNVEYVVVKDVGPCFADHIWICGFRKEWKAKLLVWFITKYRVDRKHKVYYMKARISR